MGKIKTAPEGTVDVFRVAVFSYADFTYGWFHAYDIASTLKDIDMWCRSSTTYMSTASGTIGRRMSAILSSSQPGSE